MSLRSVMGIGGSTLQNQKRCVVVMLSRSSYQYPEEEGELKRVLKEDEVDEVQDDPRPPEPEVLVGWRHNQIALDRRLLLGYVVG